MTVDRPFLFVLKLITCPRLSARPVIRTETARRSYGRGNSAYARNWQKKGFDNHRIMDYNRSRWFKKYAI